MTRMDPVFFKVRNTLDLSRDSSLVRQSDPDRRTAGC